MASELQRIVDTVAAKLHRSAALDDTHFRLQAYSPHYGPVDDTRLASILHRQVEGPAVDWILAHGIAKARRAVRVPGNTDIALLPRICAPVRCRGAHLGYLWLVDAEEELTDADLEDVTEAATAAGAVMQREQLLEDLERARERELLRDLMSTDSGVREHAALELIDAGLFAPAHRVVVFALRPVSATREPDEALRTAVELALVRVRQGLIGHNALHIGRHDRGVLLAAIQPARQQGHERAWLDDVGERLRAAFTENMPAESGRWRTLVGIGGAVGSLTEAVCSQRQAYRAARVAEVLNIDGVLSWDDLGIYRTLIQLPQEELSESALHPGLLTLINGEGELPLLETLECYLDLAGDVKATAAKLMVHRTTLYYRLTRIEKLTGLNLRSGGDRLLLHLGLKMARLAGLYPAKGGTSPVSRAVVAGSL